MNNYFCMHCFENKEIENMIINQGFSHEVETICNLCGQKIESNSFRIEVSILVHELHKIFMKIYGYEEYLADGHFSHYDRLDFESNYIKSTQDVFTDLFNCQNTDFLYDEFQKVDKLFEDIDINSSCWKSICTYGIDSVHEGWDKFSYNVKHKARFFSHQSYCVTDELEYFNDFFKQAEFKISKQDIFRGRLIQGTFNRQEEIFTAISNNPEEELGKTPIEYSKNNRFSPIGIPYGYFSYDKETALAEIRANIDDTVVMGRFFLKESLNLVNLEKTSISKYINPFLETFDFKIYCNKSFIENFIKDITKVISSNDTLLEYVPTQIMSEYIWSLGYDGFTYDSSQYNDGVNIVIFEKNPTFIEYERIFIEKKDIQYEYKVVLEESNLNEQLIKTEEISLQKTDEGWMKKLWNWADEMNLSEGHLPREKDLLLKLDTFVIDPLDSEYLLDNGYTKYPIEISYLKNLHTVSLGNMDTDPKKFEEYN